LNLYTTAVPLKMMFGILGIGGLFGALFNFGRIALLFGLAWYFAARAFGRENLPGSTRLPGVYYRDALCIGLGGSAAILGLERLLATASLHWPTIHRALPASIGTDFDAILPAASILGGSLVQGL
jgi:hypothetical protein